MLLLYRPDLFKDGPRKQVGWVAVLAAFSEVSELKLAGLGVDDGDDGVFFAERYGVVVYRLVGNLFVFEPVGQRSPGAGLVQVTGFDEHVLQVVNQTVGLVERIEFELVLVDWLDEVEFD